MSKVKPENLRTRSEYPVLGYVWELRGAAECEAVEVPLASVCSVQLDGALDEGVELHGSLDGESFYHLRNSNGSNATFYAPGVQTVGQAVRFIKPVPTEGAKGAVRVILMSGGSL